MLQASGSGLGISLLQVLMLIFAGFATLLLRVYDTKPENMDSDDPEVLGWVFMSYSIMFLYPTFILTLALLLDSGNQLASYVVYFLGIFVSGPVLILSFLNPLKAFRNDDAIDWKLYQRVVNFVSGVVVWITFLVTVYFVAIKPMV